MRGVLPPGSVRLESQIHFCKDLGNCNQEWVADVATRIQRMRQVVGEMREIKIYRKFANNPVTFEQIEGLVTYFENPDTQPYHSSLGYRAPLVFIRQEHSE